MRLCVTTMVAVSLLLATAARAGYGDGEPVDLTPALSEPLAGVSAQAEQTEWYGEIDLVVSLVGDGLMLAGIILSTQEQDLSGSAALFLSGFGTYLLAGPINHYFVAGRASMAGGSLLLRLGAPVIGAAIGFFPGLIVGSGISTPGMFGGIAQGVAGGMFFGGVIGLIVAHVLDIGYAAHRPIMPRSESFAGVRVQPYVAVTGERAVAGLGVRF